MLVYTKSAIEHRVLASTQRGIVHPREKGAATAVGEMLDKCARDSKSLPPPSPPSSSPLFSLCPVRSTPHRRLLRPPRWSLAFVSSKQGRLFTDKVIVLPERAIPAEHDTVVYAMLMHNFCRRHEPYKLMMTDAYEPPQKKQDEVYHAKDGSWSIPPPLRKSQEMIYNFTGLGGKVRAILLERPDMPDQERAELGYTTMRLAFEHIMSRVIMALENDEELLANPPQSLVMSGGVARNDFLRHVAASTLQAHGFGSMIITAPAPMRCTDNAEMIAWAGLKMYEAGWTTDKLFLPQGEWPIEQIITGVDCWLRNDAVASSDTTSDAAASERDKAQLPDSSESQNGQCALDGEQPESPQENTSRTRPSQAADRPAPPERSSQATTGRTKAEAQPPLSRSDTDKSEDPIKHLKEAERQLLRPVAQRESPQTRPVPLRRGPNEIRPAAESASNTTAGKIVVDENIPDSEMEAWKGEELRRLRAELESLKRDVRGATTAKAHPAASGEPPWRKPKLALVGKRKSWSDEGTLPPTGSRLVKGEVEAKVAKQGGEKKEKRIVRLLPPAPMDNQDPEGSLRTRLGRLKKWIGL